MSIKKALAIFLASLMLLVPLLSSCRDLEGEQAESNAESKNDVETVFDTEKETDTEASTEKDTETNTEKDTESESETETDVETDAADFEKYLFSDKKMNYRIVYPADADYDVLTSATLLYNKVKNYVSDMSFFGDDATLADDDTVEILIGSTNREESAQLSAEVEKNTYAIKCINGNIVICADKNWMLQKAVEEFMSNLEFAKDRKSATIGNNIESSYDVDVNARPRWGIDLPAYEGGLLGEQRYSSNFGLETMGGTNPRNYNVVCATETDGSEFSAYVAKLESAGYTLEKVADNEGVLSYWVSKGERVAYIYLSKNVGEARFVIDRGECDADFSYTYEKKDGDTTVLYQYGFVMSEHGKNVFETYKDKDGTKIENRETSNCGQLLIFRLADNSVMIIDGASTYMMPEEAMKGLDDFLHEITGTPAGETVTISNWLMTHSHLDHFGGFAKFLVKYHENYEIERVSFNFNYRDPNMPTFFNEHFNKWYPEAKFYRPHTGETLKMADITMDILYTYEDSISAKTGKLIPDNAPLLWGGNPAVDQNNSSIVAKITFDGKTFLLTGDIAFVARDVLFANYDDETLKSDILQVSHHGLNPLGDLYEKVAPSISLYSQHPKAAPILNALAPKAYEAVIKYTEGGLDNIYFQADGTVGISVNADGGFDRSVRPVIGGIWDGKDIYGNPV